MLLTYEHILHWQKKGRIVIDPFEPDLVSINSVDVRLGPDLWKLKKEYYRDLYSVDDNVWEKIVPIPVSTVRSIFGRGFAQGVLENDDLAFVLQSGEFYLATTLEKVGTSPPSISTNGQVSEPFLVPEMKAKSTVGRQGLTVALCAGLGDLGYQQRWALEVRLTDDGNVPIAIGTPIAQVVFHSATGTQQIYNGSERYQNGQEVRFLPKPLKFIRSKNE